MKVLKNATYLNYYILCALLITIVFASQAMALVDYSKNSVSNSSSKRSGNFAAPAARPSIKSSSQAQSRPSRSQSVDRLGPKMLVLSSYYGTTNVSVSETEGRVDTIGIAGHVETPFHIYGDISYWQASSSDEGLVEDSDYQKGNPNLKVGFNWLNMGPSSYAARVDFFGALSIGVDKSEFGASRTDKEVGANTSKRFENFIGGIGASLILVGRPKDSQELEIGNITKLTAALGWVVSSDIRLAVEAAAYKIRRASEDSGNDDQNPLVDDLSFSVVSPKIFLGLTPFMELELGAHLRTKEPTTEQNLVKAKLHNISGAYGNAVYGGLSFSL